MVTDVPRRNAHRPLRKADQNNITTTAPRPLQNGTFDRSTLLQIVQASYALNGALYAAGSALSGWAGG